MGSSSPPPAPPPVEYTPLFEEMKLQGEQMAAQQKAGQEAQRSALTAAQDTSAAQQATQAGFNAQQALGRQEAYQQAMDYMATEQAKQQAAVLIWQTLRKQNWLRSEQTLQTCRRRRQTLLGCIGQRVPRFTAE